MTVAALLALLENLDLEMEVCDSAGRPIEDLEVVDDQVRLS